MAVNISIIIPMYGKTPFLRECLDSILGQTMKEIEIICVKDSVKDKAAQILFDYQKRDKRIRVVGIDDNSSIYHVHKAGVLESRGDYLMFVKQGDFLEQNTCQKLFELICKERVDLLQYALKAEQTAGIDPEVIGRIVSENTPYPGKLLREEIHRAAFGEEKISPSLFGKMFRTSFCRDQFMLPEGELCEQEQNLWLSFLLIYGAQSYLGVPAFPCYRLRAGEDGGNPGRLSLEEFRLVSGTAGVEEKARHFFAVQNRLPGGIDYAGWLKRQLLSLCIKEWENRLDQKQTGKGFDHLLQVFDTAEVMVMLSILFRTRKRKLMQLIQGAACMQRNRRTVRTVGMYLEDMNKGGAQRVVAKLCPILQSIGYRVVVVTQEKEHKNDFSLPPQVERYVIKGEGAFQTDQERLTSLVHYTKELAVNVWIHHSWVMPQLFWDQLSMKAAGSKVVRHEHSIFPKDMFQLRGNEFPDRCSGISLADAVVVLTKADQLLWKNFNPNVHLVINPFTYEREQISKALLRSRNIIYTGRFASQQQIEQVLEAFFMIQVRIPQARLFLVGDLDSDPKKDRLLELAEELQIRDRIIFCGFHKDVSPFLLLGAVYIMTSIQEAYPMRLMESLSFGLPVVMYDLPYLQQKEPDNGIVFVEKNNFSVLADEVCLLLEDDEYRFRMGDAAYEYAQKLMDYDFTGKWKDIIESTMREPEVNTDNLVNSRMWHVLLEEYEAGLAAKEDRISQLTRQISQLENK